MPELLILQVPKSEQPDSEESFSHVEGLKSEYKKFFDRLNPDHNLSLNFYHSEEETTIVQWLNKQNDVVFMLLNPGDLTYSGNRLKQEIADKKIPFLEMQFSYEGLKNEMKYQSVFTEIAEGSLVGMGEKGIRLGLQYALEFIKVQNSPESTESHSKN